jgi:predicted enzyme related to lactoylglutathione lyase
MKPSPAAPQLFSVELRTSQWGALVEWYRSVLGLTVLVRVVDDGYALLAAGDTRLAIIARGEPGEASRRWSLGFEVADLGAVHARLLAAGADVTAPQVNPEGFRELTVTDPDGNRLRLFAWTSRA